MVYPNGLNSHFHPTSVLEGRSPQYLRMWPIWGYVLNRGNQISVRSLKSLPSTAPHPQTKTNWWKGIKPVSWYSHQALLRCQAEVKPQLKPHSFSHFFPCFYLLFLNRSPGFLSVCYLHSHFRPFLGKLTPNNCRCKLFLCKIKAVFGHVMALSFMSVYFSWTLKCLKPLLVMSCLENMEMREQNEDTEIIQLIHNEEMSIIRPVNYYLHGISEMKTLF